MSRPASNQAPAGPPDCHEWTLPEPRPEREPVVVTLPPPSTDCPKTESQLPPAVTPTGAMVPMQVILEVRDQLEAEIRRNDEITHTGEAPIEVLRWAVKKLKGA